MELLALLVIIAIVYRVSEDKKKESAGERRQVKATAPQKRSSARQSKSRQSRSKSEQSLVDSVYKRIEEINRNVENNSLIDNNEKANIRSQTDRIANKVNVLLGRVNRTRRAKKLVANQEMVADLDKVEARLQTDIQSLSDLLDRLLISVIDLEMDGAKSKTDRLINDLEESNDKLQDISDSFDDLRHGSDEFSDYLSDFDDFEASAS